MGQRSLAQSRGTHQQEMPKNIIAPLGRCDRKLNSFPNPGLTDKIVKSSGAKFDLNLRIVPPHGVVQGRFIHAAQYEEHPRKIKKPIPTFIETYYLFSMKIDSFKGLHAPSKGVYQFIIAV